MRASPAGCKRHARVARCGDAEVLRRGARDLGVELGQVQLDLLLAYAAMVRRWNEKFNLVSRQDVDRFVPRHLLDSLTLADCLRPPNILDLGTGAGLPGIPLAVARPDLDMVLLDRGARKTRFLQQVVQQLELANVAVRCQDAREATDMQPFSSIVTRAVTSAGNLWELAEPLLADDGEIFMLHRTDPHDPRELATVPGAELHSRWVSVPGLGERHEIVQMRRTTA